jgi:hypothetical protein
MDGNHPIELSFREKGGFEKVASYFGKIATTCTETVSFESLPLRNKKVNKERNKNQF